MIPKILHQTWKSPEVPTHWKGAQESVRSMNPDYEYMFWTNDDIARFVQVAYPQFYRLLAEYPHPIQIIDAFRYFVLYHYGGIYIDLDIGCKRPLDPGILQHDLLLVKSMNTPSIYTNAMMMSSKHNPFMRQCMFSLEHSAKSTIWTPGKHLHVMNSTGPLFLTNQMRRYDGPVHTLPAKMFSGNCNACNLNSTCQGGVYFYHVVGESWHAWDTKLYNMILCNWFKSALLVVVVVVLVVLFKYQKGRV
jgi:mannosyltransferase OCH1-like enzyme